MYFVLQAKYSIEQTPDPIEKGVKKKQRVQAAYVAWIAGLICTLDFPVRVPDRIAQVKKRKEKKGNRSLLISRA
jgi:hypothetical protein